MKTVDGENEGNRGKRNAPSGAISFGNRKVKGAYIVGGIVILFLVLAYFA